MKNMKRKHIIVVLMIHCSPCKGDALTYAHLGQPFSTRDQDNDGSPDSSCAVLYNGAWWYTKCCNSNLNGHYYHTGSYTSSYADGVVWYHWKHNLFYSMRFAEMKIRPFHV